MYNFLLTYVYSCLSVVCSIYIMARKLGRQEADTRQVNSSIMLVCSYSTSSFNLIEVYSFVVVESDKNSNESVRVNPIRLVSMKNRIPRNSLCRNIHHDTLCESQKMKIRLANKIEYYGRFVYSNI